MERNTLVAWFEDYMALFVDLGRGDSDDFDGLIAHFTAPMVLVIEEAFRQLNSPEEVDGFLRQMIESMRASDYGATETVALDVFDLSAGSALLKADLVRRAKSGESLGGMTVGYLVVQTPEGLRICALTVANQ